MKFFILKNYNDLHNIYMAIIKFDINFEFSYNIIKRQYNKNLWIIAYMIIL